MNLKLENENVNVRARFREEGSVQAGTKLGTCLGFEIRLEIESQEDSAGLAILISTAHQMCFTEHALTNSVPVTIQNVLNGEDFKPHEFSGAS